MKRIEYGDSSWLIGDAAADAILNYTVFMAKANTADAVDVVVIGADGADETMTLVLGPATMIHTETTRSHRDEPDNTALLKYVADRIREAGLPVQPMSNDQGVEFVDEDFEASFRERSNSDES